MTTLYDEDDDDDDDDGDDDDDVQRATSVRPVSWPE